MEVLHDGPLSFVGNPVPEADISITRSDSAGLIFT